MTTEPRPKGKAAFLFTLLCTTFASTTLLWLYLDRIPPNWDDAWYLSNSLAVYDALTHHGIVGFLVKLNSAFGFKAPLIAALPVPFYLLFGRDWHAAFLVNVVSMILLFYTVYRIAMRWWGSRAALLAVAITGTVPLLYGLARWFMVEYALTALLATSMLFLIESDELRNRRHVVLFGLSCGLGLLLKISFAIFVFPPFLYFCFRARRLFRPVLLAAIPCLILALPWYISHFGPVLRNALDAGFGESAIVQGTGAIFSFRAIGIYLAKVAHDGVSWYYAMLAILLAAWSAVRHERRLPLRDQFGTEALLLFWLLPFALFLLGGNKDVRYIAPILPAFALLIASLIGRVLPTGTGGNVLACLLIAFPLLDMLAVSFGVPFAVSDRGYARLYDRQAWPHNEMLQAIAARSSLRPGERQLLLLGVDRSALNANNLELAATSVELPFDVETTAHEKNLDMLLQRLDRATFFLYKVGGEPESPFFNPSVSELVRRVQQDGRFTEIPYACPLPGGGMMRIWERSQPTPVPDGAAPDELVLNLGGMIELTGISVDTTADSILVIYHWRCLRRPDRPYWCFTHLVDAQGKLITQFDHLLLDRHPPIESWNAGDTASERVQLHLPSGFSLQGLWLSIGLYDPPSGTRLQFGPLTGPAESRFSLADHGTALAVSLASEQLGFRTNGPRQPCDGGRIIGNAAPVIGWCSPAPGEHPNYEPL